MFKAIIADKVKKFKGNYIIFENGVQAYFDPDIVDVPTNVNAIEVYCALIYQKSGENSFVPVLTVLQWRKFSSYKNYVQVLGNLYNSYDYFPPIDNNMRKFGRMLVEMDNGVIRAVAMNDLAERLNAEEECVRGARVFIKGKAVERKFTLYPSEEEKSILEVVIRSINVESPFEAYEEVQNGDV